jgi:hypothetical protein
MIRLRGLSPSKIIELAQRGVRDAPRLIDMALKELEPAAN